MEKPNVTCNKCKDILGFYRPDLAKVLDIPVEVKDIDEVIRRHTLKPYNTWRITSPRSRAQLLKCAFQCNADADHHWISTHLEPEPYTIKEIGK
jgi:hypothetical protein